MTRALYQWFDLEQLPGCTASIFVALYSEDSEYRNTADASLMHQCVSPLWENRLLCKEQVNYEGKVWTKAPGLLQLDESDSLAQSSKFD